MTCQALLQLLQRLFQPREWRPDPEFIAALKREHEEEIQRQREQHAQTLRLVK